MEMPAAAASEVMLLFVAKKSPRTYPSTRNGSLRLSQFALIA
jgi:hypothetical protein